MLYLSIYLSIYIYIYIYILSNKLVKWLTALAILTLLKGKFRSLLFVDLALKYYRKVNITRPVEKK